MAKILVVDDEIGIRELLREILRDEAYDVRLAENAQAAREACAREKPDLVLLDIWMPDTDGVTLLKEWAAAGQLTMPVVMMSGHGTIDTAVDAIKFGAVDFLEKPIALQKLLATVKRGLQRQPVRTRPQFTLNALSRSGPMRDARRRMEQMLQKSPMLLLRVGTASLAELCARVMQGAGQPWLDLGTLASPLELQTLEDLRGGVLFVEELERLSRAQQKNLVFAMERLERCELKLIAASAREPDELLAQGWDGGVLQRLFEVNLVPPSLLELKDDVPDMAAQLLNMLADAGEVTTRQLSAAALAALRNHTWPGGFAELKAALRSLALGALEECISAEDVVRHVAKASTAALALPLDMPLREARETFERLYFEHHLQLEDGNITRLAEKTGLERTHLYRKLKQLGIPLGRRADA